MIESSTVVRRPHPLVASIDGETVMFDADQGAYFSLGSTGSRIWELIEEPTEVRRLCDRLADEFDVEPDTCRAEAIAFLEDLERAGLIEVRA